MTAAAPAAQETILFTRGVPAAEALLEAQIAKQVPAFIYLIADFQNPSGSTLSEAKRRRVLELAARHNFWVLEDVPYRRLRYRGEAPPMLRDIDPSHVLTMSSHSK